MLTKTDKQKATSKPPQNVAGNSAFCRSDFTGKELDSETGFYYFGARYLDHTLLTSWFTVDPMSDKYPSISPYAYCAWNPVKLVDSEGRDWYDLLKDGTLVRNDEKSKEHQNHDVIFSKRTGELSKEYVLGTIGIIKYNEKIDYFVWYGENNSTKKTAFGQRLMIHGDEETAMDIFKFCASNSPFIEYSLIESDDEISYLATSHKREIDPYGTALGLKLAAMGKFRSHTHNHPGKDSAFSDGDKNFYRSATKLIQEATETNYTPPYKLFIFNDEVKGGVFYDYTAEE